MLIAITGISGAGKDTFGEMLKEMGANKLLSYTTRPIRNGEKDGVDYHFVTKEEYDKVNQANDVVYAGNHYSYSKEDIEGIEHLDGELKYSIVSKDGVDYFMEAVPNAEEHIIHVHLSIPIEESLERMVKRGDGEAAISGRLRYYEEIEKELEEELITHADYHIVEGTLEDYRDLAEFLVSKYSW